MSKITVTDTTKVHEIKDRFTATFPLLKIEVYNTKHESGEGNSAQELIKKDVTLKEIGYKGGDIELVVFDDYSTNLVEHIFESKLNLNVQIFRLNKDLWIQTISTDNWTLKEQMGRARLHLDPDAV